MKVDEALKLSDLELYSILLHHPEQCRKFCELKDTSEYRELCKKLESPDIKVYHSISRVLGDRLWGIYEKYV